MYLYVLVGYMYVVHIICQFALLQIFFEVQTGVSWEHIRKRMS
jgi:hypothetical protein